MDLSEHWISGCTEWMYEHAGVGWEFYYINFMFHPFCGSEPAIISQMHRAIEKGFYGQFCTRFTRDPNSESQQKKLPKLWLFPDRPVWKRENISLREACINDGGLHFNGPMLIPAFSRFKECPIKHIETHHSRYACRGIHRIHVKILDDVKGLADYAAKTIKRYPDSQEHILILPKSTSEIRNSKGRFITSSGLFR